PVLSGPVRLDNGNAPMNDVSIDRLVRETLRRDAELRSRERPQIDFRLDFHERQRDACRGANHDDELEYGPAWSSFEWFGADTPAERMRWSRLLKRAEDAGVIVVTNDSGGRAAYIALTPAGLARAEELRAAEAAKGVEL